MNRPQSTLSLAQMAPLLVSACLLHATITPHAVAIDIEWIPGASADYFVPAHWNPNQVPTAVDDAFILSGGTAQAFAGGTVATNTLQIGNVLADADGGANFHVDTEVGEVVLVGAMRDVEELTSTMFGIGNLNIESTSLFQIPAGLADQDLMAGVANVSNGAQGGGQGTVNLSNVTTVSIGDDAKFGTTRNLGGNVEVRGVIDWNRIETVDVAGDFLFVFSELTGTNANAIADVAAVVDFARVDDITIAGDLAMGKTHLESNTANPFRLDHGLLISGGIAGDHGFTDIGNLNVAGDVDVGTASVAFDAGAGRVLSDFGAVVEFEDVEQITVGGDFNMHRITGTVEESLSQFQQVITPASNAVNFYLSHIDVVGSVRVGNLDLNSSSSLPQGFSRFEAATQLYLEFSSMTVGDSMSVGTIDGTANLPTARALGNLPMLGASLITPELRLAVIEEPGVEGIVGAEVLLIPSLIDTDNLIQGEEASIVFKLWGLDRIDLPTLDGATLATLDGTYSGIDAAEALLEGNIISDFDFVPPSPGTYSFDLVITESLTALDDTDADLSIIDLPDGFCVLFYGVTEATGVDVLRLTISTHCVPEPGSGLSAVLGLLVLAGTRGPRR